MIVCSVALNRSLTTSPYRPPLTHDLLRDIDNALEEARRELLPACNCLGQALLDL